MKILEKNLILMGDDFLIPCLLNLKDQHLRIIQAKDDPININIYNEKTKKYIYKDPKKELEEKIDLIESAMLRHPLLCIYGLGNALLIKLLLTNPAHKHIFVFESDLCLIKEVLSLIDFSKELENTRLSILYTKDPLLSGKIATRLSETGLNPFISTYELILNSAYYEEDEDLLKSSTEITETFLKITYAHGNDPADALTGEVQISSNLKDYCERPSLDTMIKDRKKKIEVAIIVSTGPSLSKQLKLLEKYHKNALIICADSAYAILASKGIRPDFVLSFERGPKTAKLFDNSFKDFDKDIVFIGVSMADPSFLSYMKRENRAFILANRPDCMVKDLFNKDILGYGNSVAHMGVNLAIFLAVKKIIFIGQDLAFSEDGSSHPKEYLYSHDYESNIYKETKQVLAYGGHGLCKTHKVWDMFRNLLVHNIKEALSKNIAVYNATEGGARIESTIEIPFKKACEDFLKKPKPKYPPLRQRSEKEKKLLFKKRLKALKHLLDTDESFIKASKRLAKRAEKIDEKEKLILIDDFEEKFFTKKKLNENSVLLGTHFHTQTKLAKLFVSLENNKEKKWNEIKMKNIKTCTSLLKVEYEALKPIYEEYEKSMKNDK